MNLWLISGYQWALSYFSGRCFGVRTVWNCLWR